MAELDFESASLEEILAAYFSDGCVLLRNFVGSPSLVQLMKFVENLYEEIDEIHIQPRHLQARNLPPFHEHLFHDKHYTLLARIFGENAYEVSSETATRRIDAAAGEGGHWQAPLGPHLDSFFHPLPFTVNFWVPFRDCGIDAPSLAMVRSPFDDIVRYSGFDTVSDEAAGPRLPENVGWNFEKFDKKMYELAINDSEAVAGFWQAFADRIWTPSYSFGDAMMSSNWTLHFTHALPAMTQRRSNIELRFTSRRTLAEITQLHSQLRTG